MKIRILAILMAMATVCLAAKCGQPNNDLITDTVIEVANEDPIPIDYEEIDEEVTPTPAPAPKPTPRRAATKPQGKTHFVSSYDSKGQVWGHVTMYGDHGTGTIHDAEENTFSVTCTRHGDELFAIDQNSRRYVFKLEANEEEQAKE